MRIIWPWQGRNREFSWLKTGILALLLLPIIRFVYQVQAQEFGILPVALSGMVFWSGVWATIILLAALSVTPVAKIFRWNAINDMRRMIGVTALIYTLAHAIIFFAFRSWDVSVIIDETVTRWSPSVATWSTVGLLALAVTSFDAAVQSMSVKYWQWLHNAIYVFSTLAIAHVLLVRGVYPEQFVLAGIFFWLMIWRILNRAGIGTKVIPLLLLAITSCIVTALLEASWFLSRRGYELSGTLQNNFNLDSLDIGVPPAWQVLAFGFLFVVGATLRDALRIGRTYEARRVEG